jgi:S-adenosylmethionine-diacylglycerol 3-amino-3-carboxypropyl transferase
VPAHSDIFFAQVREDPRIDEQVARALAERAGRPIRVLMIASGGCTALGLLALPEIERVVAVDANPAQLHWVELRRQATQHLDHQSHLALLHGGAAHYARVRPHLPPATAAYWDAHPAEIERGLLHAGRFEALFRDLAAAVRAAGLDPLGDPATAVTSPRWRPVFEQVFERTALARLFGPAAVDYSMDRSFGEHFADVVAGALRRWPAGGNYFLHQMIEERYLPGPEGSPPCLQNAAQAAARTLGVDRLELRPLRLADAVDQLADEPPFDLVHTSNISDWMPVAELRALLARIAARLAPGGAVLGRRLNGDHDLAEVFAAVLDVDRVRCQALRAADRSFFYREVVVGMRA